MTGKVIIRTSDRGAFKSCRVKWDFGSKMRQNWEPLFTPQVLDFGTAVHKGLEVYYDPLTWTMDRDVIIVAALGAFQSSCMEQKASYLKAVEGGIDPEKERDFEAELALGIGMLKHYFSVAPVQDAWFTPVKVEIEFEVPVPDPEGPGGQLHVYVFNPETGYSEYLPVFYQGRIDLIVVDAQGRYWIIDHKTAAQFGGVGWLEYDDQGGSYCWAADTMLNLPVAGVIYNQLLKDVPKPPDMLKKPREGRNFSVNKAMRCTHALYLETLIKNNEPIALYYDHLAHLEDRGNPFFRRVQVSRSRVEQANLAETIRLEALDMTDPNLRIYPSPGPAWNQCDGCSYSSPCLARNDGSSVELILQTNYRKRESTNV